MKDKLVKSKPFRSYIPILREEFNKEGASLRDQIAESDRGLMRHDKRLCDLENQVRILQEELKKLSSR